MKIKLLFTPFLPLMLGSMSVPSEKPKDLTMTTLFQDIAKEAPVDTKPHELPKALEGKIEKGIFQNLDLYLRMSLPIQVSKYRFQKNIHLNLQYLPLYMDTALKTYQPDKTLSPETRKELLGYFTRELGKHRVMIPNINYALPLVTIKDKRFVMTSPEEWTRNSDVDSRLKDHARWVAIGEAIRKAGGELEIINGSNSAGGPKEVWVRDKYLLIGNVAFLADEKQALAKGDDFVGEIKQAEDYLHSQGIETRRVKGAWFEGGNIIQHPASRTIFIGLDPRFGPDKSPEILQEAIRKYTDSGYTVIPVPLINYRDPKKSPRLNNTYLYHLDTGMSEALPNGEVLLSPDVTDKATLSKIFARVGKANIILLEPADSLSYAANMMVVNKTIISTRMSVSLREKLETRGYQVMEGKDFGLDQLSFGMGGPHCKVNLLPS